MSKAPPIDIRPDHWVIVQSILERHVPQYEVWTFGSRAKWTAKEYSDLDLAVITDKPLPGNLCAYLEEAFSESDLPFKVDVVYWAEISHEFKKVIEANKVVIQTSKESDATKWQFVTVENIASKISMGPFGSDIKTENFVSTGVPVIRGINLTTWRFNSHNFVFLTEEKADELINANAIAGDIIFTHRGPLGQVGIIPDGAYPRYVVSQSQMLLRCDPTIADSNYVYYLFKSPLGQRALPANTSQTGVPAISRPVASLKTISLFLPPLSTQRAIAHILGTLDDKIECNRRMNETLETIARAICKEFKHTLNRNHIHGLPKILPAAVCVAAFESIAEDFYKKLRVNDGETQTLTQLRDTLLPKLISGELRIKDAKKHG